jgi:Spy/CpxP family protein refolding chaperone
MGGRFGAGNPPADPQQMQERRLNFMGAYLDLTAAQKTQAKVIFDNAFNASQALQPLIQQAQLALHNAAKANASASQIDALAAETGKLMGQMRAIHAKAFAAFYQILTPVQREKLDKMHDSGRGGFGGPGGGFGGPHHR